MQTTISWAGQDYNSMEKCRVNSTTTGNEINGVINGVFETMPYHVEYFIKTNQSWETIAFEIKSRMADKTFDLYFQSNGKGLWITGKEPAEAFNGCIDIDISLTPFTNTLPIKRLHLAKKERRRITVLYIDVLEQQTRRIDQLYTKLSDTVYKYENVSNNFKSLITVDDAGLVVAYPNHFLRTAVI
jgi:hypothetical protein